MSQSPGKSPAKPIPLRPTNNNFSQRSLDCEFEDMYAVEESPPPRPRVPSLSLKESHMDKYFASPLDKNFDGIFAME